MSDTFSGATIDFEEPTAASIHLDDIAQGLSQICRYAGQTSEFYSVAQHSVLLSHIVPVMFAHEHDGSLMKSQAMSLAKACLLHDAAEAYTNDIPSPVKKLLTGFYEAIEKPLLTAIFEKFDVDMDWLEVVKPYDYRICVNEMERLFRGPLPPHMRNVPPLPGLTIVPMEPAEARAWFFLRFKQLFHDNTKAMHHA